MPILFLFFEPDVEPSIVIQCVLKSFVDEFVGWLGSRSMEYVYMHFSYLLSNSIVMPLGSTCVVSEVDLSKSISKPF